MAKKEKSPARKKKESSEVEEFLECEYLKGEYIAVRTEDRDFYLAECSNNVEEKHLNKNFKVNFARKSHLIKTYSKEKFGVGTVQWRALF